MSCTFRSGNDYTLDAGEPVRIEMMCKELRKEKDNLKELLAQEKSKNAELIRRLESDANAASEDRLKDKKYIDELERELRNCYQEIGYLQDQLNLRTVEADCMGEHVHSLELKLAEVENLNEKLRLLNEELEQSDSKRLILMREIKNKEKELHNTFLHVEKLETAISSITLDSQCEIESMKLDITALEQRCFEAERLSQQTAQDTVRMDELLEEFEFSFEESQERIRLLENENKKLSEKLMMNDRNAKGSCKVEHLDNSLKLMSRMNVHMPSGSNQDVLVKLSEELTLLKEIGTCEEVLGPFLSKLAILTAWDGNAKNEMEKMSSQIHESELIIKQLKDELRAEKQKAKEEAEDLIQAMAELRYQLTGMLEEECKRRACIEQTSLQRIQDLEAQVRKEQNKSFAALRRFQEAHELAETRSMEIRHLKNALEGLCRRSNMENSQGNESCSCGNCITSHKLLDRSVPRPGDAEASDDICDGSTYFNQALIEWYPDEAPAIEVKGESEQQSENK